MMMLLFAAAMLIAMMHAADAMMMLPLISFILHAADIVFTDILIILFDFTYYADAGAYFAASIFAEPALSLFSPYA